MKALTRLTCLVFAVALLLPAGWALGQSRMAQIDDAKQLVEQNPTRNNYLRLATLQYLDGVDALKAGNAEQAAEQMQSAVWTLEDGQVPGSNPVFEEARYGLAYAQWVAGNTYEALLPLDQALEASPSLDKAKYLKAVLLASLTQPKNWQQARELFLELGQGTGRFAEPGKRAATRTYLDYSTVTHAGGDNAGALEMLSTMIDAIGYGNGETIRENLMAHFAHGVYLADVGDVDSALTHYGVVVDESPGFQLSTGVDVKQVLAAAYYRAGVNALAYGGDKDSAQKALEDFQQAQGYGNDTVQVRHGMALAYSILERQQELNDELLAIQNMDQDYYNQITAAP